MLRETKVTYAMYAVGLITVLILGLCCCSYEDGEKKSPHRLCAEACAPARSTVWRSGAQHIQITCVCAPIPCPSGSAR